uniref:Uncharacterized protein n=1 Tax=Rangifer tarandus platyrhynchus TaxID=3082113 RepID=A0ACB0FM42_RANTA|nr:unnamed protein product [Rangifer tarandus platyrhynchus]
MPGIHSMFEVGLRRWVGALVGGEGRKVPPPTRGHRKEKAKLVPSSQLYRDSLALSLSRNYCLAHGSRQFLQLHRSLGCLQTCPDARRARQVHIPGQTLTVSSELSEDAARAAAGRAASEAGGFHLRL